MPHSMGKNKKYIKERKRAVKFSGPGEEDPTDLPWVYEEVLTGVEPQICSKGSEFSLRIGRIILH